MPSRYRDPFESLAGDMAALADHVQQNRWRLGLSREDMERVGGPSREVVKLVENLSSPDRKLSRGVLRKFDEALGQEPGTAESVLTGVDCRGQA